MSEITFAKTFLTTLDKKPIKLPADHVSDPRKYPSQSPYILPKQTHPFPRKSPSTTGKPTTTKSLTATLKPTRAGTVDPITLPDLTSSTTIHEIKTTYASKTGLPAEKIKLLLNKKPANDLKTLKELGLPEGSESVEIGVMLMGGAGSGSTPRAQSPAVAVPDSRSPAPESEKANVEAEQAGGHAETTAKEVLRTEEFWADLKGFLAQRLRDEGEGEKLSSMFKEAWEKKG